MIRGGATLRDNPPRRDESAATIRGYETLRDDPPRRHEGAATSRAPARQRA